jgi:hypothetical protein
VIIVNRGFVSRHRLVSHLGGRIYQAPCQRGPERLLALLITELVIESKLFAQDEQPSQPTKVEKSNRQEQERKSQPQTAALPGGSCPAEPLNCRFVSTAQDSSFQSPELDAAEERERQSGHRQGEPVTETEHVPRLQCQGGEDEGVLCAW